MSTKHYSELVKLITYIWNNWGEIVGCKTANLTTNNDSNESKTESNGSTSTSNDSKST